MADSSIVAFGRYLKLVRERRNLSLEDVAHLTKAYPEPVSKGYLSRVERGQNHVGFSRMVALARAYEVSLDAFGEKYALDLEVEKLKDAPETEGKKFDELFLANAALGDAGRRLHAYAYARDALWRAGTDAVVSNYASRPEQVAAATLAHGIRAVALGRFRLGLAEVNTAEQMRSLGADFLPIVSQQLSAIHRHLGDIGLSRKFADRAILEACSTDKKKFLGDAYVARALVAGTERDTTQAMSLYQAAFKAYNEAGRRSECALVLLNLANVYFEVGRIGASRRAIKSAEKLSDESRSTRVRARLLILLGEIESADGRVDAASKHWHEAIELAKEMNDRTALFKAEYQLFRQAIALGNATVLNALGRRLSRLAPWIPGTEPEVQSFRELYARHRKPKQRGVAGRQHGHPRSRNDPGTEVL